MKILQWCLWAVGHFSFVTLFLGDQPTAIREIVLVICHTDYSC